VEQTAARMAACHDLPMSAHREESFGEPQLRDA
jgi:hypothetical protein